MRLAGGLRKFIDSDTFTDTIEWVIGGILLFVVYPIVIIPLLRFLLFLFGFLVGGII